MNTPEVGTKRFLPWHRAYLIAFERKLREINPKLSLPYWDWHDDYGELVGFKDILGLSQKRWTLGLLPNGEPQSHNNERKWFVDDNTFNKYVNYAGTYLGFTKKLEAGPHNDGHNWIGGDMANVRVSPSDPAFWFHHAQIDRIWAEWQAKKSNVDKMADLIDNDAKLDPWGNEFDVENINDIFNLGEDAYEYV